MSNEVKEAWDKWMRTIPTKGFILDTADFFNQFEGMTLIKEDSKQWTCERCHCLHYDHESKHIWQSLQDGRNMLTCQDCFDEVCPEPAQAEQPDKKWKELAKILLTLCRLTAQSVWDGRGNDDEARLVVDAGHEIYRLFGLESVPEPAAKPAEPEPWREFIAACQKEHVSFSVEIEEAWWKEQERRVSRMIAEAIKAERGRVANMLRKTKNYEEARILEEEASK